MMSAELSNSSNHRPSALSGILMALVGFGVYSVHDSLIKFLGDYNAFQVLFFAMLFGYVPFSIARIADGKPQAVAPNNTGLVVLRSLFSVGSLVFGFIGLSMLSLVDAYVLFFCTPLIITVLAVWFLNEKIHLYRWAAIVMGLVGVIVVLRPTPNTITLGHLSIFASAFCGASASIIARKIGEQESTATMIIFPLLANILISGAALFFVYTPMPLLDLALMFLIGSLGVAAQFFILSGYRRAPAAFVAPMQYSQIVWAILIGYFFFGERVDQWVIVGAGITILSGVAIIWRERSSSMVQANLKTRNSRMVGAALMDTVETDEDWL